MKTVSNDYIVSFCKISTLTSFEFGVKALVEPENFCLAGRVCRTIANFYITNNRPNVIKDIGATFFGHELFGTLGITFHIAVDLGIDMAKKIVKYSANLVIDTGAITIRNKDSEIRNTYQTDNNIEDVARVIIEHIEKERGEISFSFFKELGQRLESEATFKSVLADRQITTDVHIG